MPGLQPSVATLKLRYVRIHASTISGRECRFGPNPSANLALADDPVDTAAVGVIRFSEIAQGSRRRSVRCDRLLTHRPAPM